MARMLRSSGASGASGTATTPTPSATNGTLKRKRNGNDDHSPQPAPKRDTSPLTDLAASPAVKDEADDIDVSRPNDNAPSGSDYAVSNAGDAVSATAPSQPRSPIPEPFVDGCDQPPCADDAHKLLAVLEMFDTQSLLARHVPPANISLRVMLKNPTHSIRSLRAAVTALAPIQAHPRARLSLEQTAQRSFCDLALGLLDEISQKQPASKQRTSIFQVPNEPKPKPEDDTKLTRYALQQTIYGAEYYTSVSSDSLTPEKAATLATGKSIGQASLAAIIPAVSIPVSSMPKLSAYSRKPPAMNSLWYIHQGPSVVGLSELSYGTRCSFAPTYDSSGSMVTRSEVDDLVAYRTKGSKAFGPPPPLPPPLSDRDTEMMDGAANQKAKVVTIHPDLVPVPAIDPSLEPKSASSSTPPSTPKITSVLDPTLDPELCNALDTAFQELALEDSVRGLLESNARAMTRLVDLQNERFQKWDLRKPDPRVLDVGEGEELQLARCIEKTLGLLTSLRPRTILSSLPSEPTSLIPSASALRALHRTLPTEPSPGYRGTLDPRREMSLRDDTTIKMANVVAPVVPTPPTVGTPRQAVPPLAAATPRAGYPTPTTAGSYYGQQPAYPQTPVAQYPQTQGQSAYPQGQYAGYPQQQQSQQPQGQYPVQYPTTAQQGQYPTPAQAPTGQTPYPYPYNYTGQAAGAYPQAGYAAQPGPGAYSTPAPAASGQNPAYAAATTATAPAPAAAAGQAPMYPAQTQPGAYPASAQATAYSPATYPTPGQATTYPTPGQAGTYPTPGQATTYPTPTTAYPTPTAANYPAPAPAPAAAAAGTAATPRVITNMIKPAAQGVWSPGQGYTPTPTSGYNPANPGYNPAQPPYPGTPNATAAYSPSPTGGYAATPVKPSAAAAGGLRGPIPPHVRSTPGTPASPSTYLPGTNAPLPAAAAPYAAWNGQGTPSTPRPA
ncbi:unnamed protein product [Rhizoctonia solani]|uniref:Uncharacterized protein n=1 Tax=Rhizoctonia solani TaxID=456999 RepID=A0A8H3DNL7_9AGAM|nr:unnamed protein product [Rhizoctonia solani]